MTVRHSPEPGDQRELAAAAEAVLARAPELALVFARQAQQVPGANRQVEVAARAVEVAALVRLGRHTEAVRPGIDLLAAVEPAGLDPAGGVAARLRIDLAGCARISGVPRVALSILRPVLEGEQEPGVRAEALVQYADCLARLDRRAGVEGVLAEADRLLAADRGLDPDERRVRRALVCVRTAAHQRYHGDTSSALAAAREGLALLDRLANPGTDGGLARPRLVGEVVYALLDQGERAAAVEQAEALIGAPVRATSALAAGMVMLAVATRVHLPGGHAQAGRALLTEAVRLGRRHETRALLTEALTSLGHVEEEEGQLAAALECARAARAAETAARLASERARTLLTDVFGLGAAVAADGKAALRIPSPRPEQRPEPSLSTVDSVAPFAAPRPPEPAVSTPAPVVVDPVIAQPVRAQPGGPDPLMPAEPAMPSPQPVHQTPRPVTEQDPDDAPERPPLLDLRGLRRQLAAVRESDRPATLALVKIDPGQADQREALDAVADQLFLLAPERAELARFDATELIVLLPGTTMTIAEHFANAVRETVTEYPVRTGIAEVLPDTGDISVLGTARDALTPIPPKQDSPQQNSLNLLAGLSISAGSGGRRRAPEQNPPHATVPEPPEPDGYPRPPEPDDYPPTPSPAPPPTPPDPQPEPDEERPKPFPDSPDVPGPPSWQPETETQRPAPPDLVAPNLASRVPVYGPPPRPPDLPPRSAKPAHSQQLPPAEVPVAEQPEAVSLAPAEPELPRSAAGLADLLAEALVAYQSGRAEQDGPAEQLRRPARGVPPGRHRSPEWTSMEADGATG